MPIILKILISLAAILTIQRLSKQLILAVTGGTLLLAFWSGHSLSSFARVAGDRFLSIDNFALLIIIALVIWLSMQMAKTGAMKDLLGSVKGLFPGRASAAVLPAVIGLLPMPGGALFSAPLVEEHLAETNVQPLLKTKINYWFRHIWEYWLPLYPGVLVAIDITGLDPLVFMAAMAPLSLASITIGYFFFLRKIKKTKRQRGGSVLAFLKPLVPIMIIIAVYALVQAIFPGLKEVSHYLPITAGIIFAIIIQQIMKPLDKKDWKEILTTNKTVNMVLIVAVIRIYGAVIESEIPGSGKLFDLLQAELANAGIPALALIILLPFISAITTGIAVGFAGAGLPIAMQLVGANPSLWHIISIAVLAYGSGYVGLLLSPVHVCLIVTNEHFKTGLFSSISKLLLPALILFAVICLWSFSINLLS